MPDKKITSIPDLIKELKAAVDSNRGPVWYRGHAMKSWKLQPNYDRLKTPLKEMDLLNKFRQNAHLLLSNPPTGSHDFSWMFLMQHYGVPTRLLDWTESPLVALYFAVANESPDYQQKDAALWVLYPLELNQHSTKSVGYIPSFEDEWLANYSVDEYNKEKDNGILPIAAIATRNNPRIQAQVGVFTISHLKKIAVEDVEDGKHCIRFVIPWRARDRIKQELQILGINRFHVFPELSSIGENLRDLLK